MLIDEAMPVYDVSDAVATVVDADVGTTWDALMEVDLLEVGRKKPAVALGNAHRCRPAAAARACTRERRGTFTGAGAAAARS